MSNGAFARIGRSITWLRNTTLNLLFLLLLAIFIAAAVRSCDSPSLSGTQALVIAPIGTLTEEPPRSPGFSELLSGNVAVGTQVADVLRGIRAAGDDERIGVIVLSLEELFSVSLPQAQTIGAALQAYQEQGGTVIAYGTYYTQGQYLLASYADELYLHPMGQVLFSGFGSYSLYFKDLLEKLNIDVNVFRAGEFKSAVEPFTGTGKSDAARTADQALIDTLWQEYAATVGANRQMSDGAFKSFVNSFDQHLEAAGGDLALALIEGHVVDELLSLDELNARIGSRIGFAEDGTYESLSLEAYLAALGPELPNGGAKIGLIATSGPILMNADQAGFIAAERVRADIREARRDRDVAALVVRIDSPGGSAFASEIIRQELELTQLAGKPVVISMGNAAASGGYWVAATADRIYAHPSTVTGSIGVFSLIPTFGGALESAGIYRDGVGTAPLSGGLSPAADLSPPLRRILQGNVDSTYQRFTELVARGRELPLERVRELAQGRVWAGRQAFELGLVDELGGLDDALAAAAELAGVDRWAVKRFEPPPDPGAELARQLMQKVEITPQGRISRELARWLQAAGQFDALDDPRGVYALCDGCDVRLLQ